MKCSKYQICEFRRAGSTAWGKAPNDVAVIAEQLGYKRLNLTRAGSSSNIGRFASAFKWLICAIVAYFRVRDGSVVLLQYPCHPLSGRMGLRFLKILLRRKHVRLITLVHDFGAIQQGIAKDESKYVVPEQVLCSEVIIAHNEKMGQFILGHGVKNQKIVLLECFDYLMPHYQESASQEKPRKNIVLAGSYRNGKSEYVYELDKLPNLNFDCFGIGFDEQRSKGTNVTYCGAFDADDPPDMAHYEFGLVWDGDSTTGLRGTSGCYYKIVNPHKLSMFLASDIPVIVNKESAVAGFVSKNEVGLVVGSLAEVVLPLEEQVYRNMLENAARMGRKLRAGEFTRQALALCESLIA